MKNLLRTLLASLALLSPLLFSSCQTASDYQGIQQNKISAAAMIKNEEPGDYWIGRRFYKQDYKFWGFVRRPGQPWNTAKLVMLNEQTKLAPDREGGHLGSDNNSEYKLKGDFSGQTVYEPASNGFYPEFVLKSAELVSVNPPDIYHVSGATDPTRRIIPSPR